METKGRNHMIILPMLDMLVNALGPVVGRLVSLLFGVGIMPADFDFFWRLMGLG